MSKENIVRHSADEIRRMIEAGDTQENWAKFDSLSDEEIDTLRRSDPDFEDFDWSNATIVVPVAKSALSIRVDQDVLDFFKASGKGYQTRINTVLRAFRDASV